MNLKRKSCKEKPCKKECLLDGYCNNHIVKNLREKISIKFKEEAANYPDLKNIRFPLYSSSNKCYCSSKRIYAFGMCRKCIKSNANKLDEILKI